MRRAGFVFFDDDLIYFQRRRFIHLRRGEGDRIAEKIAHLPKVAIGKRMTRAALEVALEVFSEFVIAET